MKFNIGLSRRFSDLFLSITFFGKVFRVILQFYDAPTTFTKGITSRCFDSRHVLLFDYDKIELEDLDRELKYLQNEFNLGVFYVFKMDRPNAFHVFCLDKFCIRAAWYILRSSSCDVAFVNAPKFFLGKEWVLRTERKGLREKPEFLYTLKGIHNSRQVSTAHKLYLEKHYPRVPKLHFKKEDGELAVPVIIYNTSNRVK